MSHDFVEQRPWSLTDEIAAEDLNQAQGNLDHARVRTLEIDLPQSGEVTLDTGDGNEYFYLIDNTENFANAEFFFQFTFEYHGTVTPQHGDVGAPFEDHHITGQYAKSTGTEAEFEEAFTTTNWWAIPSSSGIFTREFVSFNDPHTDTNFGLKFYARASDGALILKATGTSTGTPPGVAWGKARLSYSVPHSVIEDLTGDHSWSTSEPT